MFANELGSKREGSHMSQQQPARSFLRSCYYVLFFFLLMTLPPLPAFFLGFAPVGYGSDPQIPYLSMTFFNLSRWLSSLIVIGLISIADHPKNLKWSTWVMLALCSAAFYSTVVWVGDAIAMGGSFGWLLDQGLLVFLIETLPILVMIDVAVLQGPLTALLCTVAIVLLRNLGRVRSSRYGTFLPRDTAE